MNISLSDVPGPAPVGELTVDRLLVPPCYFFSRDRQSGRLGLGLRQGQQRVGHRSGRQKPMTPL